MKRLSALVLLSALLLSLASTPAAALPAGGGDPESWLLPSADLIGRLGDLVVSFFASFLPKQAPMANPGPPPNTPASWPWGDSGSCLDPDGRPAPCEP